MAYLFWISLLFVVYTYLGYPLVIVLWSKLFPKPVRQNIESFEWPKIAMIIVAYNEEKNILRKIENCRELDYPKELLDICVVSDGSTDGTNKILLSQPDIHTIIDNENRGKPYQINRAIRETVSDVVLFADSRQIFEVDSLRMLVGNFSDPKIGAVSGELVFVSPEYHTERNIGLYWKYEKILRKAESDVDSTLGVTGAIYAIRRELFMPIPDDTILDDVEIPLHILWKGFRVILEPKAHALDLASSDIKLEFRRKSRTLTGNFQLFTRNLWILSPIKNRIFIQSLSHKLFRLVIPYALLLLLITSLASGRSLYRFFFVIQAICYITSAAGLLSSALRQNRVVNFLSVFITLNAASVVALYNHLFRGIDARWHKQ